MARETCPAMLIITSSPAPDSASSVTKVWRLSCHRPFTPAFWRTLLHAVLNDVIGRVGSLGRGVPKGNTNHSGRQSPNRRVYHAAADGKLKSSNPNLQNIPIRTVLGREIRAAFVPREGWKLLVADYSQIELRLLAHMSDDPLLLEAFRNGEDIHTRTASEVLGVPPMLVTPDARRDAKAVNFGIVYGISAFGLAAQLGIGRGEAERYIRNYFARYAGVRRFIDETIAEVRRTGVARTLFGRERAIPDINARNPNARGFAERVAVNSPLQGTAADLIKLAMVRIGRALEADGRESAMLLQVHDELVFECPPEEVEAVSALARREMEGAYELKVPMVVDVGVGDNWRDAK